MKAELRPIKTNRGVWVINPLTSMTFAAEELGYSYGEMGSRIVNLAAARHPVFRHAKAPAAAA